MVSERPPNPRLSCGLHIHYTYRNVHTHIHVPRKESSSVEDRERALWESSVLNKLAASVLPSEPTQSGRKESPSELFCDLHSHLGTDPPPLQTHHAHIHERIIY